MPHIRDTIPEFETFARKAGFESPFIREMLWSEMYRGAHPDVFAGLDHAVPGSGNGLPAMVRELSKVRARTKEATPLMRRIIEEIDPKLADVMGLPAEPSPVHVLMVGGFTTNSAVGRVGDDIAVFHCVEWYQTPNGAQALIAHEASHAWHQIALRRAGEAVPLDEDLAWTIFSEGLATQVSRAVAPHLPEVDYFWYGHPESQDWLAWCEEHAAGLKANMLAAQDLPEAADTFFGAGLVDGRWRVGYHVADRLVASLGRTLPELVALPVDDARKAVTEALAGA